MLYYTILYYNITIPCYTILNDTILHYTIQYYTILGAEDHHSGHRGGGRPERGHGAVAGAII